MCVYLCTYMYPLLTTFSCTLARVGNASQVSDGAAAVLLGRRSAVEALGLPVLGILRAAAVVGVPPDVMGIGPAYAIPAALEKAGRTPRRRQSKVMLGGPALLCW